MISYHFYGSKEPLQDISKFHQWEGPYFSPEKSGFFPKNKNKLLPRGGIEPSSSEWGVKVITTTLTYHWYQDTEIFTNSNLNPISGRDESIWPRHHTFVSRFHRSRARITQIGDFVFLSIELIPGKPFLKCLFKSFWIFKIKIFRGPQACQKKYFFLIL